MTQGNRQAKEVLWISRHTMTETQRADLERIMGGAVHLTVWSQTVANLETLRPLVERSDAIAAVLPVEKLAQLLEMAGNRPVLQASSARAATGRWVTQPDGTVEQEFAFVHQGWQQLLELRIRTRAL